MFLKMQLTIAASGGTWSLVASSNGWQRPDDGFQFVVFVSDGSGALMRLFASLNKRANSVDHHRLSFHLY